MRTRFRSLLISLPLASAIAGVASADQPVPANETQVGATSQGGTELCGHLADLEAARNALRNGDRQTALRHLRHARALLTTCEQRLGVREATEPTGRSI